MPWFKFRATVDNHHRVLGFVFEETDCRVYEAYSQYDQEPREFGSIVDCESKRCLGVDQPGRVAAQQLSLWSPSVMPPPTIRRIELETKGHRFRYVVEGCGLFWLQLGAVDDGAATDSCLGYFTEAGARKKCMVKPGPEEVDWLAHRKLADELRRQLRGAR